MFNVFKNFANLGEGFYQYVKPDPLDKPYLIHTNSKLINYLGLSNVTENKWLDIINGNLLIDNYQPIASIYAGHQFGAWVPQLGDGRALLIAEHKTSDNKIYELQLKGAGKTPYSRFADGRAVLRSSIREYLCSHAMNSLGIETTEALGIITSSTCVYREEVESGAIVLRVANSFIRFGHFELFASRNQTQQLAQLTEFIIDNYYPNCNNTDNKYLSLLDKVSKNTAKTVAKWQAVGFCHGVMNTDNMSILGLTLDYGPFGFLEKYDPNYICNHSDTEGRYSYQNQPQIAWWNLGCLAESLRLLTNEHDKLQETLNNFAKYFNQFYIEEMGHKLGISNFTDKDLDLLKELLDMLNKSQADWTIFWRNLSKITLDNPESILDYVTNQEELNLWLKRYLERRFKQDLSFEESQQLMLSTNPAIVLRNHLAQIAISKAKEQDYSELERLFNALSSPFVEIAEFSDYYNYPPSWAEHISVSCSS